MPSPDSLLLTLRRTADEQLQALKGRQVVVGVSGGADSVALLHLLHALQSELDLRLIAAHLDHGLRPESASDSRHVSTLAAQFGVSFVHHREDVDSRATTLQLSIETAARQARYEFLTSVCRREQAILTVGHNRDDQAETVLLNLARGSGITGLTGMASVCTAPGAPDITLVRPLLSIGSCEIREYCQRWQLPVLEDASNLSLEYSRNRIRHTVLPALHAVNAEAGPHITRTAELLRRDEEALDACAEEVYARAAVIRSGAIVLERAVLRTAPSALQIRVLRRAAAKLAGTLEGIGSAHLIALQNLLEGDEGRATQLPLGIQALTGGGQIFLWQGDLEDTALYPLPLVVPEGSGWGLASGWHLEIAPDRCLVPGQESGLLHEHVRRMDGLEVRAPLARESFRPLGMSGSKLIQDFLADRKVPRSIRRRVPVVASKDGPVWVVGWRLDDRARLERPESPFTCLVVSRTDT